MVMTRSLSFGLLLALATAALGCNKPSEDDCKAALTNMRRLMGTENSLDQTSHAGDVRRCKGGSTKSAVSCAMKAQTIDELHACDFMKVPSKATDTGSGSAK
jgi:hypothetical protein